jgi:transcriptional regulator with XRE-family HTH domain
MENTLGQRIAALRKQKGLTQDALAEHLGISAQAVSKWENDQTCPDISLLSPLAEILGVSTDELLSGKKDSPSAMRILPEEERKDIKDMMLRITVQSADKDWVRINLPLALIKVAIESGLNVSQVSGNTALNNIDLGAILALVDQGAIGNLLEIESADGDTVRIFVE